MSYLNEKKWRKLWRFVRPDCDARMISASAVFTQASGLICVLVLASFLGEPFSVRRGLAVALVLIGLVVASGA